MDSKLLYSSTRFLRSKINWENEWIYFGIGEELKFDIILDCIGTKLNEQNLFLILDRNNSRKIQFIDVVLEINPLFGVLDFELWNWKMSKVIQFNKVGVLNFGIIDY